MFVLIPEKPHAEIRAEQVRLLYQQGSMIQVMGICIAVVTAILFWDVTNHAAMLTWLGAVVFVMLARLVFSVRFRRIAEGDFDVHQWESIYTAGTFVSGVAWGVLAFFYDPGWPMLYQAMLFIIFTGLIGAAFNTNGSVFMAFPAFYVPLLAFLTFAMLKQSEEGQAGLAVLFLIYAVTMHASSVRFYNRLTHTLKLQRDNEKLTARLAQSNERLARLAEIDPLTQVFNRRHMDRFLAAEWQSHYETQRALSLLFIDIDFFKQYNDTYGHGAGDRSLSAVARTLKKNIRAERDVLARYGGEEFAVILPHTDCAEAKRIAGRIMRDIWMLHIDHTASGVSDALTVSIGIATMVPDTAHGESRILDIADRALYNAKHKGRNRMACAD